MKMNIDINKILQESCENAFAQIVVDLVSNMVHDNPDWCSEKAAALVNEALRKALNDNAYEVMKKIIRALVEEPVDDEYIEDVAREVIEKKLKNVSLKVEVEDDNVART